MDSPLMVEDLSVLILEATFYKYSKEEIYKERAISLLYRLVEVFPEIEFSSGFLEGFEGIFHVVSYLVKCNIIEDDSLLNDLKPHLLQSLEIDIDHNNFDLYHGSINKLQYVLHSKNYAPQEKQRLTHAFIDSLYRYREESEDGIFWFDMYENGKGISVNLGLPHGLPALLVFLLQLKELGYTHSKLMYLVEGILQSLLRFRNLSSTDCRYPDSFIFNSIAQSVSRLAYCYGDVGIAYAFAYAYRVLKKEELKIEASEIIEHLSRRILSNSKIDIFEDYSFVDTAFCHGLSGIVYTLTKINHLLPHSSLEKRISYWTKELYLNLDIQLQVEGKISYPTYRQTEKGNHFTIDEQSFLAGYTGTGLVLLSLIYQEYDWSDFLLLYS